jgi:hypothetical protein
VRKLEPGHSLTWRPGHDPVIRKYWDVPTTHARSRAQAEERVRVKFDESVKAHLEADVPVAAFLSGGLDSSAVVTSMALAGEKAHAYTVRYTGTGAERADESGLAKLLTDRYGLRLTVVDVDPDIRNILEPIVHSLDEPHADESAVPTWLLCERVAKDYKVALVGTGGDELFAGYRRHFALAAAGMWQKLPGALRRGASALGDRMPEPGRRPRDGAHQALPAVVRRVAGLALPEPAGQARGDGALHARDRGSDGRELHGGDLRATRRERPDRRSHPPGALSGLQDLPAGRPAAPGGPPVDGAFARVARAVRRP